MRIGITGADGFLGWHSRCRFQAMGHQPVLATRSTFSDTALLKRFAGAVDAVVHAAGVNRASGDGEIVEGNRQIAERLDAALDAVSAHVPLIYTNSTQSEKGTVYGEAKQAAAGILATGQARRGAPFIDLVLPHLFGEFGRPFYNSAVTTFAHCLATGATPEVNRHGPLELLHAQDVAAELLGLLAHPVGRRVRLAGYECSVGDAWDLLEKQCRRYLGDNTIPAFADAHELRMFNTLRSQLYVAGRYPLAMQAHVDHRGAFAEVVRSDGLGQTSISTSLPGVKRGDHFHFDKVERFVVLRGQATIRLRKLFSKEVRVFEVGGDTPAAIDMPPICTHNITNTGSDELLTLFWAADHFDPSNADTYFDPVEATA